MIVNVTAEEEPVPGVVTVMLAVPAVAIFAAGTGAVNEVALTYVVVSPVPFQLITELLVKLVPVAVSVNADPPAMAVFGVTELSTGTGGLCTINASAVEVPAPAVETVILSVPAVVIFAAGTIAVNEVALTNVVVSAVVFQLMVDVLVKLVPVAISVKAELPAITDAGATEVRVGLAGEPL